MDIFRGIVGFLPKFSSKQNKIEITHPITKMHHRLTCSLLAIRCILVSGFHWVGTPIECWGAPVPQNTLNTYCWLKDTYTIPCEFFFLLPVFSLTIVNQLD